jgi:hypothetical protein
MPAWRLRTLILWVVLAQCLSVPLPVAAEDGGYLAQLRERAQRERLAERPEWRALLHYKPLALSRGFESQVDAESFFLSPRGKHEPQAELDATLASFFENNQNDPEKSSQCLFAARYHWLKQALEFDPDRLPQLPCRRFNRWFEEMNPGRLTLIFPAAYLNNPASMFGHTLLRIDAPGEGGQTRLLAYTINYAADTSQQRGVPFAYKGLFGLYRGRFSIAPYYAAVKTYGDIENRDIWEYGLNLAPGEITQLLRHVWELRAAWFDYYFLDENCSYHLLSLLEVARPGLRLSDRFPGWVIPSETVRAVAEAGLVDDVRFRPARNSVLLERARQMESRLQALAKRLASGETAVDSALVGRLAPLEQARAIELALDYAAYRQSPRFGGEEQSRTRVAELLKARSRLDVADQTPLVPVPDVWPGNGHTPVRAGIAFGFEKRRQFVELRASPAYHDLFDPQGGFAAGAKLTLLNASLRYYPEQATAEIERIDLIDIMSLSSWNRLLHPVSWKVALGLGRKQLAGTERLLMGHFNGGIGISHDFSRVTSAHLFAEGTLELSDRFEYFASPGLGPRIGILHDFSERWRSGLFFLWQLFFLDEWRNDYLAAFGNRFTLNSQNILGLDLELKREFGNRYPGVKLYWQYYF